VDGGCGKGAFSKKLAESGAAISGIDITSSFIEIARRNVPDGYFMTASATHIPYGDGVFDAVFCFEVLEHIPDTKMAIEEMARVLKPGGKILICDKNILAIHPQYYIPVALHKRYMELRDRWMYPKKFPFREKWFIPSRILKMLKEKCSWAEIEYLPDGRNGNAKYLMRILPFLSPDVIWKGIK
jgi:ubiquinone/menaquinone biosynthesis C-methylase UbiE